MSQNPGNNMRNTKKSTPFFNVLKSAFNSFFPSSSHAAVRINYTSLPLHLVESFNPQREREGEEMNAHRERQRVGRQLNVQRERRKGEKLKGCRENI